MCNSIYLILHCRIHQLLLSRSVRPPPNEFLVYVTKQSDGEVPVMLELWGMQSTSSVPSLPGWIWPDVVAPDSVLSIGKIELNCELCDNAPSASPYLSTSLNNSVLAGDSSSGSDRGIIHFFMATRIQLREWEKKNNEQTNNMDLG